EPDITAGDHSDFEDQQDLLCHPARDVGDDVREPVQLEASTARRPQLDADEQEEERDRQRNQVRHTARYSGGSSSRSSSSSGSARGEGAVLTLGTSSSLFTDNRLSSSRALRARWPCASTSNVTMTRGSAARAGDTPSTSHHASDLRFAAVCPAPRSTCTSSRFSLSFAVVKLSVALVGISLPCEKSCDADPPGCSTEMASPSEGGRASRLHAAASSTASSTRFIAAAPPPAPRRAAAARRRSGPGSRSWVARCAARCH